MHQPFKTKYRFKNSNEKVRGLVWEVMLLNSSYPKQKFTG